MVVRIRLGRGTPFPQREGANNGAARLAASLLTLTFISLGSFGLWRIGADLGWTGDFVFSSGILSHWQVWIAGACVAQYLAWQLSRYARKAAQPTADEKTAAEARAGMPVVSNV